MNNTKETDPRFAQLSKEIVAYCQMNSHKTEKCINFVLYELELRCVSKDVLAKMAEQIDTEVSR